MVIAQEPTQSLPALMHWLGRIARRDPKLFVLWEHGVRPEAGGKSRMTRERPVRICQGGEVRSLSATRLVVGFEYESDARRFWDALCARLQEFALSLHPDKTRL